MAKTKYAAYHAGEIAKLENDGAIVVDKRTDWGVLGWAGRLDLARNVARSQQAMRYRYVRIYDIATGAEAVR